MTAKLMAAAAALASLVLIAGAPALAQMGGGGGSSSSSESAGGGNTTATPREFGQDPMQAYQAGAVALNAHNYPEAIRLFRITQHALPRDGAANFALGLAYAGNNQNDEAKDCFKQAVRASNAPANAFVQLARMSLQSGDRDTATAQQATVHHLLETCTARCGDERRAQLQTAYDDITAALAAPPAAPATSG